MHITIRCKDATIRVDCCIQYSETWGHALGSSITADGDEYRWAGTVDEFRGHWPSWRVWSRVDCSRFDDNYICPYSPKGE